MLKHSQWMVFAIIRDEDREVMLTMTLGGTVGGGGMQMQRRTEVQRSELKVVK